MVVFRVQREDMDIYVYDFFDKKDKISVCVKIYSQENAVLKGKDYAKEAKYRARTGRPDLPSYARTQDDHIIVRTDVLFLGLSVLL